MTETQCPPELAAFSTWLSTVVESNVTRRALGDHLGAGGRQQIDKDLSHAYLPAWQYVVSAYLGPVQEITGNPLAAVVIDEGKRLYSAATSVTEPYTPSDRGHESYSRIVAPVLAGFSLPAIVTLATAGTPGQPYRDIALACFVTATGLFLAGLQLTIGRVYIRLYTWGKLRSGLTFSGIVLLVAALMVLIAAVSDHWWIDLALAVLGLGGITQALALGWMRLRPPQANRPARRKPRQAAPAD